MATLDIGYDDYEKKDDYQEIVYPTVGTYQVVKILEAEFKESNTSDAKWFSIKGTYPEFPKTVFFKTLWVPRDQGDEDRFKEEQSKFLGQLKKMGVPLARGMQMEDLADSLVGRFARAKIYEEEDKRSGKVYKKPAYFHELKGDQVTKYPQPESAQPQEQAQQAPTPQEAPPAQQRSFGSGR